MLTGEFQPGPGGGMRRQRDASAHGAPLSRLEEDLHVNNTLVDMHINNALEDLHVNDTLEDRMEGTRKLSGQVERNQ